MAASTPAAGGAGYVWTYTAHVAIPCYGIYELPGTFAERRPALAQMIARHVVGAALDTQPERFAHLSPISQTHSHAPPFLVIHGDADSLIPVQEARAFVAKLRTRSQAQVRYLEVPGAEHAFDLILSRRTDAVLAVIEAFLAQVRAPASDPPPVPR